MGFEIGTGARASEFIECVVSVFLQNLKCIQVKAMHLFDRLDFQPQRHVNHVRFESVNCQFIYGFFMINALLEPTSPL